MNDYLTVRNQQTVPLDQIPVLPYEGFLELNTHFLQQPTCHCVNYYGVPNREGIQLFCCIAEDSQHQIYVSSAQLLSTHSFQAIPSFTARAPAFQVFERELHENFGLLYLDHPWLKPLRYAFNRTEPTGQMQDYPFYGIPSEDLHEVAVGPIHAGVIEPGHFRFLCSGEQVLHLEIQLGYQHRGIEALFLQKKSLLQRTLLAESIAGDTVVAHTTAFVQAWESLCGMQPSSNLLFSRTIALELERMAIHTVDLAALCNDIGYQLGFAVFGRLRSPLINFMQQWCGNRLSKGLIRMGQAHFPFTPPLAQKLLQVLELYERDFLEMAGQMEHLPSVLTRLKKIGTLSRQQAQGIGMVGMCARASGVARDIRSSHPFGLYSGTHHIPLVFPSGDVLARAQVRIEEIKQSIAYIRSWLPAVPEPELPLADLQAPPTAARSWVISLVEGWRGEICHCAITDEQGALIHYKIKDPSLHNWMGLALAVRNQEIADFPICNKSFDLSYCGNDL
ncbi:MAG: hydrogenase large subunit [Chitinophagaceae bacterium]